MGLRAAGVKAQVRIGGDTPPNPAAALDLNTTDATNTGTKTLALPRVSLASTTDLLSNTSLLTGMLVYNTGGSLSAGVYYWNGSNWNRVDDGFLGGDTIVGNEVTGATPGRGLARAGSGTSASPFTLGIAPNGIDTTMLSAVPVSGSILFYVNGSWRTAHYGTGTSFTIVVPALASSGYVNVPANSCLTTPNVVVYSCTGCTTWDMYYTGSQVLVFNANTITASVNFRGFCWLIN